MLCGALQRLASDRSAAPERDAAARELQEELRGWAPGYLRRVNEGASDALIDDAIQHCLMKASLGTRRFRGSSEGEARNWCKTVLRRFVLDSVRRGRRHVPLERPASSSEASGRQPTELDPDAPSPERLAIARDLQRLLSRLVEAARNQNGGELADSVQLWLEYRLSSPTVEAQIERWAFRGPHADEPRDEDGMKKARNRVYTWRKRGRQAACAAAKALLRTGTDAEDAHFIARLLGCRAGEGPGC